MLVYELMDPVNGAAPSYLVWKTSALAVVLHRVVKVDFSQPLYKYYIMNFEKNQIFTFQNLQVGVVI